VATKASGANSLWVFSSTESSEVGISAVIVCDVPGVARQSQQMVFYRAKGSINARVPNLVMPMCPRANIDFVQSSEPDIATPSGKMRSNVLQGPLLPKSLLQCRSTADQYEKYGISCPQKTRLFLQRTEDEWCKPRLVDTRTTRE
jgi:hypothetical protein